MGLHKIKTRDLMASRKEQEQLRNFFRIWVQDHYWNEYRVHIKLREKTLLGESKDLNLIAKLPEHLYFYPEDSRDLVKVLTKCNIPFWPASEDESTALYSQWE